MSRLRLLTSTARSLRRVNTKAKSNVVNIFDREAKRKQRNRAGSARDAADYDLLKDKAGTKLTCKNKYTCIVVAENICNRLLDIKRTFPVALDVGCGRGHISKMIDEGVIGELYECDSASNMLMGRDVSSNVPTVRKILCDGEFLPFRDNMFDLVTSNLSLHWHNDLPAVFKEVFRVLKPDGAFLATMFSGDTLYELRCSLQLAELERTGGISPRISPFVGMRDIGGLLGGFALTTIDNDDIIIDFPDMLTLMNHLRGMGESNCIEQRKTMIHRDVIIAANTIYCSMYGNEDGSIPATFEILNLIGWKPHASQPKALRRGSATTSLKDLDKYV